MSKLRLIQCGVGGHGNTWVQGPSSTSPDFDLVAVVDVVAANFDKAREHHKLPPERCYATLEAALAEVEADAVLTVTPPAVHLPHARLAFEHGLHVITEKPIADTVEGAKEMVKMARQAGRQLVVSQNYRYSAPMRRLKSLAAEAPVGAFGHGDLDFYIPADFTGSFRENMAHVLLVDMAVHHLDLIRTVTGRDIVAVTARSFRPDWSWYQGQSALKMLLDLEDGLSFTYSGDWSGLGRCTAWNGTWRLQCADGSIHLDKDIVSIARCERWGREENSEEVPAPVPALSAQYATLSLFAEAIRSGVPAEISGEDNIKTFAAVMAGVKSAEEGRTVAVSELLD